MFKDKIAEYCNTVKIIGRISSVLQIDHNTHNTNIYACMVEVFRKSRTKDIIPVQISENLLIGQEIDKGSFVTVMGELHSFNNKEDCKNKLKLFIFAKQIIAENFCVFENKILLKGFICKNPVYRITPLGRKITDVIMAINRRYGKSDYIPCIFWGRNARELSQLEVGAKIVVAGRLQSRSYIKKIGNEIENRIAYEVSAIDFRINDTENTDVDNFIDCYKVL